VQYTCYRSHWKCWYNRVLYRWLPVASCWCVSWSWYSITITSDLSSSQHINEIVNKAHQRANHIIRCVLSGHTSTLIRAFIVYLRPILEYNCVIWSPSLKRDIDLIERVQRRFTKRMRGLKDLSYTERLLRLNIPSLELRRLQLDLIFCYKIVFGRICTNSDDSFAFSPSPQTRGHPYKLYKSRRTHAARRNFFVESHWCRELFTAYS